jgi:uncharacterized repeat protein (TIGR02543 family)
MENKKRFLLVAALVFILIFILTSCDKTKTFNVTFINDSNKNIVKIKEGETLDEPKEPTKDGYTFTGWYLSDDKGVILDEKWDFTKKVTFSFNLYAKWVETPLKDLHDYAIVNIRFFSDNENYEKWYNDFYEENEWNYFEIKAYKYTQSYLLFYKNKETLLSDFSKFKHSLAYTDDIYIELRSIGKEYGVVEPSTTEDLISFANMYEGTEIVYETIPNELLTIYPFDHYFNGSLIIDNYEDYLTIGPFEYSSITEDFFLNKSLVIAGGVRSSSYRINGVSNLYKIDSSTINIGLDVKATSNVVTDVEVSWIVVLGVEKEYLTNINRILSRFEITFDDGFYKDVPFYNTIDERIDDYVDLEVDLLQKHFTIDELQNFEATHRFVLNVSLLDKQGNTHNLYYHFNYFQVGESSDYKLYIFSGGFHKVFDICVAETEDVEILKLDNSTGLNIKNSGYIDDYGAFLETNMIIEKIKDESFFEDYSLYVLPYTSSDTNLVRKIIKHEVLYDKLHIYLHKPAFEAGGAITNGLLLIKVKKELRNLGDNVEFVEEDLYSIKEDHWIPIANINHTQYQDHSDKHYTQGYIKNSENYDSNNLNHHFYQTYEEFINDIDNIVITGEYDLSVFDKAYFARRNLLVVEAEVTNLDEQLSYPIGFMQVGYNIYFTGSKYESETPFTQKILIFLSVTNNFIEAEPNFSFTYVETIPH